MDSSTNLSWTLLKFTNCVHHRFILLIALNPRTLPRDLSTSGIKERKTRFERNSIVEDKDAGNGSGKGSGRETWESSCGRACNHELVSWETSRSSRFVSFRFVSFRQTEPSTKTDFVFVSAKVKTVRNRIVRGGPTNRERLSLMVIPFFLLFRWVFATNKM